MYYYLRFNILKNIFIAIVEIPLNKMTLQLKFWFLYNGHAILVPLG